MRLSTLGFNCRKMSFVCRGCSEVCWTDRSLYPLLLFVDVYSCVMLPERVKAEGYALSALVNSLQCGTNPFHSDQITTICLSLSAVWIYSSVYQTGANPTVVFLSVHITEAL